MSSVKIFSSLWILMAFSITVYIGKKNEPEKPFRYFLSKKAEKIYLVKGFSYSTLIIVLFSVLWTLIKH